MDLLQTIKHLKSDRGDVVLTNNAYGGIHSMTVQTVLLRPSMDGLVYWVLNRQETKSLRQGIHSTPKLRGWGNPGGGVELVDCVNEHGVLHSFEKTVASCGKRELVDETGFTHFEFKRNAALELPFIRYNNPYGHCVITLLAQLYDDQSIPVKEVEEIMCGAWFDLSLSPVESFQGRADLPYWSHVRRTITVLRYATQDADTNNTVRAIHSLWNLVFPIVTQDTRFPRGQYLISPPDWYHIMRMLIMNRVHTLDLDFIYDHLGHRIEERRRQENDSQLFEEKSNVLLPKSDSLYVQRPSEQERMVAQYEEDYRRWAERLTI